MNTIRELKQQEKYKTMLKRKNKEKKKYKDINSTLRIKYEGIKKLLEKKDKEIERLKDVYEKNLQLVDKLYLKDKEIEKLKEKIENMKMSYETDAEAKYYDFVNKHESKLQQRIDKAVEYLNQPYRDNFDYSRAELLDILQGVDKE